MSWLLWALSAATLNGGVSVVDKFIVSRKIPNPIIYSFFLSTYGIISAIIVLLTVGVEVKPIDSTIVAFFSGSIYLVYIVFYFAAMNYSDASVVVALAQISPVFSALLGYLLLGERFTSCSYVAIVFLILGAVTLSIESDQTQRTKPRLRLNRALGIMVIACIWNSISQFMLKYALKEITVWDGFFWPRLGVFVGAMALLLIPSIRQSLESTVRNLGVRINVLIMSSEATALVAVYATTLAYNQGPLTLVSATSATQPFFITLFIWVINYFRRDTIPDRTNLNRLALRLPSLLIIILGVYLLGK